MRQRASILVGLLWCLAILSVVVVSLLYTARLDLRVVNNHGDLIQARYLALAGVEKAKALLYQDARERRRSANHHTGQLYDSPQDFREVALGRGHFRVFRAGQPEDGGRLVFGISDEESRLNVNVASADELKRIQGMTAEIAAAILDWRDPDDTPTQGGAEAEYYSMLRPPYLPRNGPFESTLELLMVRGVSRDLLLGPGRGRTGASASAARGGAAESESEPPEIGWARLLTVESSVRNLNAAGEERVNIQSADESSLSRVHGLSTDLAKAIVAYRGQNRLQGLADLLDVVAIRQENPPPPRPMQPAGPGQPGQRPPVQPPPPAARPAPQGSGEKLISESLLMDIADDLTAEGGEDLPGVVNLNTADATVLACLPGIDESLAQAIVAYRQSAGFFANVAWLLKVPRMNRDIFKQAAPRVTVRSETFRIMSEGRIDSSGARQRIQVVVRVGRYDVETLSYREETSRGMN
jgi:DNA uptake protein ComE-like DNA-binding protein